MKRLQDFIRRYRWFLLVAQAVVCVALFLSIHFSQRGIQEISLADAERKGGLIQKDGNIYIDETDGAYGLYLNAYTDEIPKGWYKVHIGYETGYDDNSFLIRPLNGNPDAINQDVGDEIEMIALKSQNKLKSAHVWVEEPTGLQIGIHFCGGGYLDIKSIRLEQVANYTPVFFVVFLFVMIDFLCWEAANVEKEERKRRNFVRGGIILITLIASIPLMNRYLLTGYDQIFHLARIEGIAEGLCSGQFPVRIAPQWWNEYGYAHSVFYGDILLYFPAILLLLNYKLQTALKCYIAFINFLTAFLAYKSFMKIGKNEKIALLGSAFYSLTLFRLMQVHFNSAVGAYTAMAFLPLILAGIYCIKEKRGWVYLALGLTGCVDSHIMSCEMVGIFMILFFLVSAKWVCQKAVFLQLCKAGAATLLWNLWFLVPFLNLYMGDYKVKETGGFLKDIQQGGRSFEGWSRAVIASLNGSLKGRESLLVLGLFVGLTSVCGLVFVGSTIVIKRREREIKQLIVNAGALAGFALMALFLCTQYFPYDFLCTKSKILATLIRSMQFPWRFYEMAAVFAVAAIVVGFVIWEKLGYSKFCMVMAGILGVVCLVEVSFYYHRLLVDSPQMAQVGEYYTLPKYMETTEYLPAAVETLFEKSEPVTSGEEVEIADYKKEYTTIQVSCVNRSEQEAYMDVPLFFYPCYKAKDMETGEALALTYGENAKIRIMLPPGYQGMIKLEVNERKLWKMADLISLLSILTTIIFFIWKMGVRNNVVVRNKEKQEKAK